MSSLSLPNRRGGFVVASIVKSYLMYDDIPARLYRNILVETDGKKYRLRILEGEVSESHPYVHVERNRRSRLYGGENKAREAAEMLLRKFSYVGWHVYSPATSRYFPSDRTADMLRSSAGPATARMRWGRTE
jgi:hypothetical protein